MKRIRAEGSKVFVLSNNFRERTEYYNQYPWIHELFDKVYLSWQTGLVKPDIKAWQLVLEEHGLRASRTLYFDDKEKNLGSPASLGISAHLYRNPEQIEQLVGAQRWTR